MKTRFALLAFFVFLLIPAGIHNVLAQAPACVAPPAGMISWWPGDGNTNDIVGTNPGSPSGVSFPSAKVSQGFGIGGGSVVSINDAPSLEPQQFSIDAWVNPTNVGQLNDSLGAVIISKDENTINPGAGNFPDVSYGLFGPGNTGKFTALVDTVSGVRIQAQSTNSFAFGQFHHVAMTWDGTTVLLYVNGQLEGSASLGPQTIAYGSDNVGIGAHTAYNPSRYFNGIIDEVEFFNIVLTQSQIQSIFNADSAGKCKIVNPDPEPQSIGGETIPIQSISLILAGINSMTPLMIPIIVGIGIVGFLKSRGKL